MTRSRVAAPQQKKEKEDRSHAHEEITPGTCNQQLQKWSLCNLGSITVGCDKRLSL
jgi:hypothetical protein